MVGVSLGITIHSKKSFYEYSDGWIQGSGTQKYQENKFMLLVYNFTSAPITFDEEKPDN